MGIPNMLKVSLLLSSALFSCIAHSECKMSAYQIHGVVTNSTNQKIAASIRFSWLDNETKKRNLAAITDAGDYSATLYYDTQSKADSTSGRIYNCDAKLKTVQYVIESQGYSTQQGSIALSGESTEVNFTLPNPSIKRDAPLTRIAPYVKR